MNTTNPLTAADLFQIGYWIQWQDHLFEIIAWDAHTPLQVEARCADTGIVHQFTLTDLFNPGSPARFASSQTEFEVTSVDDPLLQRTVVDAATLPDSLLRDADRIIQTVESVQTQIDQIRQRHLLGCKPFSLTDATRQACQALSSPVSLSSYYVYRRIYQINGGDRALIAASRRRSTYGKTQIDPNAQHFLDTLVRRFYRTNPPLRAQTVYNIAQQLWHHNQGWWINVQETDDSDELIERLLDGRQEIDSLLHDPAYAQHLTRIKLPSRAWFYGYVSWFSSQPGEGVQTYISRHGKEEWAANFLLFDRFAQTASLPLQYVFADHYQLDVLHVDDEFRELLGRLWLTVFIDAYSRAVTGLFLSYEAPNIESIQGGLRNAIWPKTNLDRFGIDLPWNCYGIPHRLFLDNAWAHHSLSLEDLVRTLTCGGHYTQMELVFRPPYQARYGGLVERLFGNLSGRLRELLPGAVLPTHQRRWHNASQGACLLYRDVVRLVNQMMVDYMHTPHQELESLTPHEMWLAGLQLMTPVPPPLTPQLQRSFWRLHPGTRVAANTGLSLFGLHYWDVSLAGLRGRDRNGRRRRFHLRYDPDDISRVAVFEHGTWLGDGYAKELRLPDGRHEPVSLWELRLAKDLARQINPQQTPRPHSWLIHLLEARELIAQRQAEQKLIRRKLQQLKERRRGRPTSVAPAQRQEIEAGQRQISEQALTEMAPQSEDARSRLLEDLQEML